MRLPYVLLVLSSLGLSADGLSNLKDQLSRLPGHAAVKGNLEIQIWNKAGKGKEVEEGRGNGSVWVEDGPQGLRLIWPKAVLQQLEQESKAEETDPKAKSPMANALNEARPTAVAGIVNAGPALLRMLERSKLLEEKREAWNGQPATLLILEPGLKAMSEEDRKRIKKFESRLQVWISDAGVPLAARETRTLKASVMLMSIENHSDANTTYAKVGDRLFVVREDKKERNIVPIVGEVQSHKVLAFTAQ